MIGAKFRAFDWGFAMRRLLLTAVDVRAVSGATAADMPDYLRGSIPAAPVTRNWDGWYVGGQASYSAVASDFQQERRRSDEFYFS